MDTAIRVTWLNINVTDHQWLLEKPQEHLNMSWTMGYNSIFSLSFFFCAVHKTTLDDSSTAFCLLLMSILSGLLVLISFPIQFPLFYNCYILNCYHTCHGSNLTYHCTFFVSFATIWHLMTQVKPLRTCITVSKFLSRPSDTEAQVV